MDRRRFALLASDWQADGRGPLNSVAMRLWPVVLDCQPGYLSSGELTLVWMPLGADTVFGHLRDQLYTITKLPPVLVCPSTIDFEAYRARASERFGQSTVVCSPETFSDGIGTRELADALLIVDSRLVAVQSFGLGGLVEHYARDPRVLYHLVAFETGLNGTKERVAFDTSGQIRSIRRHYEPATWPFITGVSATILPVACGVMAEQVVRDGLTILRRAMTNRGTLSRDIPLAGGAFNLTEANGLLVANEHFVLHEQDASLHAPSRIGHGATVAPSVRMVGSVVIHPQVIVDEGATLVGPTVIGNGARIESNAFVAHALIGPQSVVPTGTTVHDSAWFATTASVAQPSERRPPLYNDRVERVLVDRHAEPRRRNDKSASYVRWKRLIDGLVAATALLFLLPLLLTIGIVIALQGDGPVFYGDEREGLHGRTFKCWKFRTMSSHADAVQRLHGSGEVDGPHFKMSNDPRVTKIGKLLRASNLDELPQLWNVLVGEMSLVGPRPSPFRENQVCVPWREARISVRPGITGLWQVCRHDRAAGDFHQWIEYDLLYVQHLSLRLDLKIAAGTILTLGGKITHLQASSLIRGADLDTRMSESRISAVQFTR
jgi:lipopolysaccharide/colanic/teichoic acid biosynthesis glycosyltransferase